MIVPFVHTERIGTPTPFDDRPAGSVAVVTKTMGDDLFRLVEHRLATHHPHLEVHFAGGYTACATTCCWPHSSSTATCSR